MFRKILAVLLGIIFFFLFALVLYGYNVKYVFLKPTIYKELLEKGQITNVVSSLVVSSLQKSQAQSNQSQKDKQSTMPINPEMIGQALTDIVNRAGLEKEVGRVVDNFFIWLYSDKPNPDLSISLQGLKQSLQPEMQKIVKQILLQLPPCTPAELKASKGEPNGCLPPNMKEADLNKLVSEMLPASTFKDIPDSFNLVTLNQNQASTSAAGANPQALAISSLNKMRDYVHLGFLILNVATGLLILLLILIGLLIWRPFSAILKKIGILLLISSIPIFLLSLCLYIFAVSIKISDILKLTNASLPLDSNSLNNIGSIFADISKHFNLFKSIESGSVIIFSIILLVIGALLKKNQKVQQR